MIFNSYKHFSNTECEYYPCHDLYGHDNMTGKMIILNCLFCFCPLYHKEDCGGNYTTSVSGIRDCSNCCLPHDYRNYGFVIKKIKEGR